MDISDLKSEKLELEQRIQAVITEELKKFAQKTGVAVESVTVHTETLQILGNSQRECVFTQVSCRLAI